MFSRKITHGTLLGLILVLSIILFHNYEQEVGSSSQLGSSKTSYSAKLPENSPLSSLYMPEKPSISSISQKKPFWLTISSPLTNKDFQLLSRAGGIVQGFIPPNSLLLFLDDISKSNVASLPFVNSLEPAISSRKNSNTILKSDQIVEVKVQVHPAGMMRKIPIRESGQKTPFTVDENLVKILNKVRELGGRIVWANGDLMTIKISSNRVSEIAVLPEILWIENTKKPTLFLDNVRDSLELDMIEQEYGYNGSGIRVAVYDTGCRWSHTEFGDSSGTMEPNFDGQIIGYLYDDGPPYEDQHGHGTAVAGIVGGLGVNPAARGVAPGAKLFIQEHGLLELTDGPYLGIYKAIQDAKNAGVYLQTNSWGTTAAGQYTIDSAEIDRAILELGVALVYAAGNSGPSSSTLTWEAASKNAIAVGSVNDQNTPEMSDDSLVSGSSRGPTEDGRIKPDIVAPGHYIFTTSRNGGYLYDFTGTSAAAPVAAGLAVVLAQAYREDHWHTNPFRLLPSPALLKTLLIASAEPVAGRSYGSETGWGIANPGNLINSSHIFTLDQTAELQTGQSWKIKVRFTEGSNPRLSLAWTDPPALPGVSSTLVNDLDLIVISPSGTVYRGNQFAGTNWSPNPIAKDSRNNIENVFLSDPADGDWTVIVNASSIWLDGVSNTPEILGQNFALTISDLASPIATIQTSRTTTPAIPSEVIGKEKAVIITVADSDANLDSFAKESIIIQANSSSDSTGISLSLWESADDSAIFQGQLMLGDESDSAIPQVKARTGDIVRLMYNDEGLSSQILHKTLQFDSDPPEIYGARFLRVGRQYIAFECSTSEMADTWLELSLNGQDWVKYDEKSSFSNQHSITARNLKPGMRYYIRVAAMDSSGNYGEQPEELPSTFFTQHALDISVLYVNDTLESNPRLAILLDQLNIAHDTVSSLNIEAPALVNVNSPIWGSLTHYDLVLWDCGWTFTLTLSPDEREAIENHKATGGSILFVGADIGYDANTTSTDVDPRDETFRIWYENNLKAIYMADDVSSLSGIPHTRFGEATNYANGTGDPISETVGGLEALPDSIALITVYTTYVEAVKATGSSSDGKTTSFVWENGNFDGCVIKDETSSGRLVYQTMPYDSIRGGEHQLELLRRELNWLISGNAHNGILNNQTTEIIGEISDGFRSVPEATVYLFNASESNDRTLLGATVSDEKGLVRFTDTSEGSYDIEIFYKDEWEFEDFNLGTPITITRGQSRNEGTWLLESRGIIGSVHSKSGEEALTNATVSAILNNSIILSVFTDNKGDFQLRGIPTGNYSLFVVAEGYIPSQWNEIELVPELNTTGIELELEKASTDILLVIESPEGQHLELPLGLMDYPVTIWPSYEVGSPRAQDMSQFDAVIWYAGITATMNSHLNGLVNETEELQDYLENQGNLLLIGQDVIYDLGANHPFIQEILGVQSVRQDIGVTDTLTGVPNDAIGSNIRLNCHQGMFLDYADKVTPAAGASGILEGINDNFYYGIRKDGSSRVIFFPFDTNLILSVEETAILINQCLSWFGTAQQGYETEYQPKKESTAPEWPGLALLGTLIVITLLLGAVLFGKRRQGKNLKETTE